MEGQSLLLAVGKNEHEADKKMALNCDIWEARHPEAELLNVELSVRTGSVGVVAALGISYWEPG